MSPILRLLLAVLFGGMAIWFRRFRFNRGEPACWFFAFLVAVAVSSALSAASWWIRDDTISRSFWVAHWGTLSLSVFLTFGFARSFSNKADYTLLFWSLPLMFDLAIIVVDSHLLLRRSGNSWVPYTDNAFFFSHIAINLLYALMSLYYCFMVYATLRSHGQKEEAAHFGYVLAGLLVIFASQFVAGSLRAALNPGNPITEAGTLLGSALLLIGVVEPKIGFLEKNKQGVA